MNRYITCLSTLIILFLAGCENEIGFRDKDVSPKLILNSLINVDNEVNYAVLNFTGKKELGYVTDGLVEITVNGELKETCTPKESSKWWYLIHTRFSPGDVVRIDAYAGNGKYHAWAEGIVPEYPIVTAIDTLPTRYQDDNYWYHGNEFKQLKFKIGIEDLPESKDFYRIEMEHTFELKGKIREMKDTTIVLKSNDMWPWDDVVLTDGHPATTEELETGFTERIRNTFGVFRDTRFANSAYTMTVSSTYTIPSLNSLQYPEDYWNSDWRYFSMDAMNIYSTAKLQSITEAQYYYLSSLNSLNSDYYDDMMYDPVAIPSNVNGGTGFVGFCSETRSKKLTIVENYKFGMGEWEKGY